MCIYIHMYICIICYVLAKQYFFQRPLLASMYACMYICHMYNICVICFNREDNCEIF